MKFLGLFLLAIAMFFCGQCSAQCYTDPLTGLTVCQQPTRAKPLANIAKAQPVRSAAKGVYEAAQAARSSGNCTGNQYGYGSSGSVVAGYGSSGSSTGYGSSGSAAYGFQVGARDYDGALITSIGKTQKPAIDSPPVMQVAKESSAAPIIAPTDHGCPCGPNCTCGPDCDCGTSKKQLLVRKEDFEPCPQL